VTDFRHRALLFRDRLIVVPWRPNLRRPAPGLVAADLEAFDEELVVRFLSLPASSDRNRLAGWAEAVGYRRIWFDDEVRDLDPVAVEPAVVTMRCSTCGSERSDGSFEYWSMVRHHRRFPDRCTVCGGLLEQPEPHRWSAAEEEVVDLS
jgi:hypothetical protein